MRNSFLIILFFTFLLTKGETTTSVHVNKLRHQISFQGEADYVFSSVRDEFRTLPEGESLISTHGASGLSARYSFSFTDPKIRNYIKGGYQGVGVGFLGFFPPQGSSFSSYKYIGFPILTYVFQGAPIVRINKNLTFGYEWQFGASFGWKPYSMDNRYFNLTVGSHVNAYLNVGFKMSYNLTDRFAIEGGVSLSHFSNGNTSWPNPGVNLGGVRLGVVYEFADKFAEEEKHPYNFEKPKKIEYNVSFWTSARKRVYRGDEEPVLLNGHYLIGGLSFSPLWTLGRHIGLGPSADIEWDQSSNLKEYRVEGYDPPKFRRPPFFSQLSVGVSCHVELKMPVFTLNAGVGWNIVSPSENKGSYQNITLKVYLSDNIYLNIGYQLRNFYRQSSLMPGVGITF